MDADKIIAKILFGLIKVAIIFVICVRIDIHSQGIDMRSGVVCDKQIVHHIFNDSNEYVITISKPATGILYKYLPKDVKTDFSVSPEIYCKYQVGDEFDSTTEIW